jgi:hypothetical protein
VKPAEAKGPQAKPVGEAAAGNGAVEEDDDSEAAAVEGYLPPRPS